MADVVAPHYLVIGHVTRDILPDGFTVGGTVAYAGRTALALGCRVAIVTSGAPELDLSEPLAGMEVARVLARATTTFENTYTADGRRQVVRAVAEPLGPEAVPSAWRQPRLLHLGPVAGECDPALIHLFPGAFIGLTPQGWMRSWDADGRVSPRRWEAAEALLPHADAVVLAEEDVAGDWALLAEYAAQTPVLVVTQAAAGCVVYAAGKRCHFPAPEVEEVDPTGAGDIFAAAFFIRLRGGDDPWVAARFANCVAAISVTRLGLAGTPTAQEATDCLAISR